jgi:hypothetical protein
MKMIWKNALSLAEHTLVNAFIFSALMRVMFNRTVIFASSQAFAIFTLNSTRMLVATDVRNRRIVAKIIRTLAFAIRFFT